MFSESNFGCPLPTSLWLPGKSRERKEIYFESYVSCFWRHPMTIIGFVNWWFLFSEFWIMQYLIFRISILFLFYFCLLAQQKEYYGFGNSLATVSYWTYSILYFYRCREKQRKEASRLQAVNRKLTAMNKLLMEENDRLQKQVSQLVYENSFFRQQTQNVRN